MSVSTSIQPFPHPPSHQGLWFLTRPEVVAQTGALREAESSFISLGHAVQVVGMSCEWRAGSADN